MLNIFMFGVPLLFSYLGSHTVLGIEFIISLASICLVSHLLSVILLRLGSLFNVFHFESKTSSVRYWYPFKVTNICFGSHLLASIVSYLGSLLIVSTLGYPSVLTVPCCFNDTLQIFIV